MKIFVCHSNRTIELAKQYGWLGGAKYTNLRDVRGQDTVGLLDIDWQNYCFDTHLSAAEKTNPLLTIARDVECLSQLDLVLRQAERLKKYALDVAIVPKAREFEGRLSDLIPEDYILAYSVPTRYAGTTLPVEEFLGRKVHLLGGRPDVQRKLGERMDVVSVDGNRFTLDAKFGDYFDGCTFRPHPVGGYFNCLKDSIINISKLWNDYSAKEA